MHQIGRLRHIPEFSTRRWGSKRMIGRELKKLEHAFKLHADMLELTNAETHANPAAADKLAARKRMLISQCSELAKRYTAMHNAFYAR